MEGIFPFLWYSKRMEFFRYSFLFFFGGTCGWVIELFFRRFVSQHKWVNPGFLTGPFLPLYGFGAVGFYLFASLDWQTWFSPTPFAYFMEIICIGLLLTAIEYVAGLIFIKGLKIKLWDYSKRLFNLQGIICPLFSLIWTACGAVYVFLLHQPFVTMTNFVMSSDHILVFATLIGLAYGFILVDLGWSLGLVKKIRTAVSNSKLVVDWDKIKVSFQESTHKLKQKTTWVLPFYTKALSFQAMMGDYLHKLNETNMEAEEKLKEKQAKRKAKRDEKIAEHIAKKEARDNLKMNRDSYKVEEKDKK